jgi:ribosomal protein S18 acetylase RimI-like enzyme
MWARAAETGSPSVVVAEVEDHVVGFIAYGSPREPGNPSGSGEVWAIYVHPDSWRMGVGQLLLRAALDDLAQQGFKSAYLWALVGNDRASVFYQQFGFILEQGARKHFELAGVQSGEDKFAIDLPNNAA